MGSGAKHKKKQGERRSRKAVKPKLIFLCDENLAVQLREEVNSIPGYRTYRVQDLGLKSIKDPSVLEAANRRNALILTNDKDFLNQVDYRICTHRGILCLRLSTQRSSIVRPHLRKFLEAHYTKCKHTIVELRDRVAIVTSKEGQEPEIAYFKE